MLREKGDDELEDDVLHRQVVRVFLVGLQVHTHQHVVMLNGLHVLHKVLKAHEVCKAEQGEQIQAG